MTSKDHIKRVTMSDVAKRAGVGTATVDRVINERGDVSEDVSRRVLHAARTLGLKRVIPHSHRRTIRIDVILARPELPLIARMGFEFRRISSAVDKTVVIHRTILEDERPETLAAALSKTSCDAVVSYMQDHPLVHSAVEELSARSVPVVTVISDVPGSARIAYAGTDHFRAGRTAGYFITKMSPKPGPMIILCNHLGFQSHADRLKGVSDFLREKSPDWQISEIIEGGDDRSRSETQLLQAFKKHPDTAAVYNVGAANIGVARAIRADVLTNRPIFVGHELTRNTAAFLREGLMSIAIDQNPELQVRLSVNLILRHFEYFGDEHPPYPIDTEMPIVLYSPENIPNPLPF